MNIDTSSTERSISFEMTCKIYKAVLSLCCDLFFIFPQRTILGSDFFNKVCGNLKLLEKEYFGLEFRHHTGSYVSQNLWPVNDANNRVWS